MNVLSNKRIVLGITGGIAAYKSAVLARLLVRAGAELRVVMTPAATHFITPLTLQALSGNPVSVDLLDPATESAMGHIELARWADAVLVAPATADFLARLRHGMADDLLATLCLATQAPIIVAPAMNQQMWFADATQENLAGLRARGVRFSGPDAGSQACGEEGPGRMQEPDAILADLNSLFTHRVLAGVRVLVTAGPTREAIDPVRFLGNRSSGKMGFAIAAAAREAGADTTLVAGPVALATPPGVRRVDVTSAADMAEAVLSRAGECDLLIAAAAVADFSPRASSAQKIKKTGQAALVLELVPTIDILAAVAGLPSPPFTVGFAAETVDLERHARAKLDAKHLDMIAANLVSTQGPGFETDDNALAVYWGDGERSFPLMPKARLARELIDLVASRYRAVQTAA